MKFLKNIMKDLARFIQYGDLPTSFYIRQGMVVGKNFNRQSGCKFDPSHCWLISIGDDVTFANRVQLLAHDDSPRYYTGYGKIGRIKIGNRVFVGANTTILMNVNIGDDVIIAAGSIVVKDIPSGVVVAGVPAREICSIKEYIKKINEQSNNVPCFDNSYSYDSKQCSLSMDRKKEMYDLLNKSSGLLYLGKYED